MKYDHVVEGTFCSRPNRFVARVMIEGEMHTVHVKNTGRCKELLIPGVRVYLEKAKNPARKTSFDLIAVEKQRGASPLLINMDSQAPNRLVEEWIPESGLFSPDATIRREVSFESSRFDLLVSEGEKKSFIEVKGVTLERDGVALFPDAPTLRGVKHLRELTECKKQGFGAFVIFVVQMKGVKGFAPNADCHREFANVLTKAKKEGVRVLCVDCRVSADEVTVDGDVPLLF